MTIWATTHGTGPFLGQSLNTSLILVQGFVCIISITIHVLAASISEKRNAIIALREREENLKRSEEKYRNFLENLPQKIFHKNITSVYISCNENYAKDLNIKSEEISGTTDYIYYPKKLANKYIDDDKRIINSGKSEDFVEKYFINEKYFWVHTIKIPLKNEKDQITGILGIFRDITELKRLEDEKNKLEEHLRQSHKMEAIGTLAGGIAHDFNNILTAIIGYADLTLDDIPKNSPIKNQIEQILKASHRVKELVTHILSFSRKGNQKLVPVNIYLIVKDTLKLFRASIPTTIEFKQNINSNCGNILADSNQIQQVIMNLCTNATYAMEKDSIKALELFSSKPDSFDLVITDYTMPNLTGEELAKKILKINSNIPIIICTGYSAKMDKKKSYINWN